MAGGDPATRLLGARALRRTVFPGPAEDERADRDLREGLRNVSPETLRAFVLAAVAVQAGLFAVSLGLMLVWFRGQRAVGGGLVVGGLVALAVGAALYRRQRSRTAA